MDEEQLYDLAEEASQAVEEKGRDLPLGEYVDYLDMVLDDLRTRRANAVRDRDAASGA